MAVITHSYDHMHCHHFASSVMLLPRAHYSSKPVEVALALTFMLYMPQTSTMTLTLTLALTVGLTLTFCMPQARSLLP